MRRPGIPTENWGSLVCGRRRLFVVVVLEILEDERIGVSRGRGVLGSRSGVDRESDLPGCWYKQHSLEGNFETKPTIL